MRYVTDPNRTKDMNKWRSRYTEAVRHNSSKSEPEKPSVCLLKPAISASSLTASSRNTRRRISSRCSIP
ncbi:hypothetical protein E2C01_007384 [Portunus trituberculatus]|uniref:Uncharacterized protein n=1 Tax=Portunus trituberculatus TaxID=210409 RepID=A0A5B7D2B1_PORTR|nr:hypothetical protein [Portunus trituberculatus]